MPERMRWRRPKDEGALNVVKRGTRRFREALEAIRRDYVDAHYPGLQSYAYNAELLSIDEGEEVMERILREITEIDWNPHEHPAFKIRNESGWRHIDSMDDFPQPTSDSLEEESE